MISIIIDIAYKNPRTYPICVAILSLLMNFISSNETKKEIISKIKNKFSKIPNTGHMEIWIQRMTLPIDKTISYSEPICNLINGEDTVKLWNCDWISSTELQTAMQEKYIVDKKEIRNLEPIISKEEVEHFVSNQLYNDEY